MTETLSPSTVVVAARDQISADVGGEAVILVLKSGQYYGLNDVGTRIWELLQEPKAAGDIRDAILEEYAVEPEVCEKELLALLTELAGEEMIEVRRESLT